MISTIRIPKPWENQNTDLRNRRSSDNGNHEGIFFRNASPFPPPRNDPRPLILSNRKRVPPESIPLRNNQNRNNGEASPQRHPNERTEIPSSTQNKLEELDQAGPNLVCHHEGDGAKRGDSNPQGSPHHPLKACI